MPKGIEGEVVRLIDRYRVAISVGEKDGVKKGMKFVIYIEAEELLDSDNRSLGRLEIPKAEIKIIHVQPEMSVGESTETYMRRIPPALEQLAYPFGREETAERMRPLPIDEEDLKKMGVYDLRVRKGDRVRRIA